MQASCLYQSDATLHDCRWFGNTAQLLQAVSSQVPAQDTQRCLPDEHCEPFANMQALSCMQHAVSTGSEVSHINLINMFVIVQPTACGECQA